MSNQMPTRENDELLIAYLLGELPEAECVRIEEQYLADETAFAPLLAVEAELYDAYARNSLSPERRRLFEQKFLSTPEQRWQLEFSRTLQRVPRPDERPAPTHLPWGRLAAFAGVAVVLTVVIALWWFGKQQAQFEKPQVTQQAAAPPSQVVVAFELGSGITRDGSDEPTLN